MEDRNSYLHRCTRCNTDTHTHSAVEQGEVGQMEVASKEASLLHMPTEVSAAGKKGDAGAPVQKLSRASRTYC